MPKKETPEILLTNYLGKTAAKALLDKIDKMIAIGDSAGKIEEAAQSEITANIGQQVSQNISVIIGPENAKLVKPITAQVKKVLSPAIGMQTQVSNLISQKLKEVKIGPKGKIGPAPKIGPGNKIGPKGKIGPAPKINPGIKSGPRIKIGP